MGSFTDALQKTVGKTQNSPQNMSQKSIKSIQELGELFTRGDVVDAASNCKISEPFNRIFRVSMKSSKMAIPKSFEEKLTRWFHLPGDPDEEQSIKRAELQTVGNDAYILF